MSIKGSVGRHLAPRISDIAPGLTTTFVRESLNRAIDGVGPLPPAAAAADKQLKEQRGHVERRSTRSSRTTCASPAPRAS